jgi:hypothetical protein
MRDWTASSVEAAFGAAEVQKYNNYYNEKG